MKRAYTVNQIKGYITQLRGVITADKTGSEVTIHLRTANALLVILEAHLHNEMAYLRGNQS